MWSAPVQVLVLPPFRSRSWRGVLCVSNRPDVTVSGDSAEEVSRKLTATFGAWLAEVAERQTCVYTAAGADFTSEEGAALRGSGTPSEAFAQFLLLPTASRWSWLWTVLRLSHEEIVTLAALPPDARVVAIEVHKAHAFAEDLP